MSIQHFLSVKHLITQYETQYQRASGSVRLLVVSKKQSVENIAALYHVGQTCFGESYLQEALPKIAVLPKEIEWHFIGPIQANKTRKIAEHFSWVHSVENKKIAQRLSDQRPPHLPPLNICIEINISQESSKSGIAPNELLELATFCNQLPRLQLRGLMAIPAPIVEREQQRAVFHQLFLLYQSLITKKINLDTLSMGMSDDFEAAIAEGSTLVRIGRAIW